MKILFECSSCGKRTFDEGVLTEYQIRRWEKVPTVGGPVTGHWLTWVEKICKRCAATTIDRYAN